MIMFLMSPHNPTPMSEAKKLFDYFEENLPKVNSRKDILRIVYESPQSALLFAEACATVIISCEKPIHIDIQIQQCNNNGTTLRK